MTLRDRLFESLLAFAGLVTLGNFLYAGIEKAVFVDADGRPLGVASRIVCPRCGFAASYILEYPVYECRTCGHRHLPGDPPCSVRTIVIIDKHHPMSLARANAR